MTELAEIVRENVGKNSYQMRQFFQQMVKRGELKAYTRKRATLTLTEELRENQPVFIKDPETRIMYYLDIRSEGGMFYNDGNSQTMYHHCVLERLTKQLDPKKVATRFDGGTTVPKEMVAARLRIDYDQDCKSGGEHDYVAETRGNLVVEGKQDKLFKKVCKFVRER
ncbi:MAG: hypothetical protein AABY07_05095 [Nanoarchaeota archaeon]